MALVAWNDKYLLGIDAYDEHHCRLVTLLNETYEAVRLNNRFAVKTILVQLSDYATYHFSVEEEAMAAAAYPALAEHQQAHAEFTRQVAEFAAALEGDEALHRIAVVVFLRQWLLNHILKVDRELVDFLVLNEG